MTALTMADVCELRCAADSFTKNAVGSNRCESSIVVPEESGLLQIQPDVPTIGNGREIEAAHLLLLANRAFDAAPPGRAPGW